MTSITKAGDDVSQHFTEDAESQMKKPPVEVKGADRAAQLIGDQQVEVTEEDVRIPSSFFATIGTDIVFR